VNHKSLLNDLQVAATNQLIEALVESEARARHRLELLCEVVFELDDQCRLAFLNPAWTSLTGIPADKIIGSALVDCVWPDDRAEFRSALDNADTRPEKHKTEIRFMHANGSLLWMELSIVTTGTGYVGALHDVTMQKNTQEQLEYMAHFDVLTKLPNRTLLTDRIDRGLARCRRIQRMLAVAFLDLDGFKAINDQYGHDAGDHLLTTVAQRFVATLREEDSIARIGGDEFVVVLTDLEYLDQALPILTRLLHVAAEPVQVGADLLQVSASIGVTVYPQDDVEAEHLLRHADQAMYVAKQSGKGRYHFFDVAQNTAVTSDMQARERLQIALSRSEFVLAYQPKLAIRTNKVFGAEALIRWRHPDRGLLLPHEFLPVLENRALSLQIGEWVIATALAQLSSWARNGQDFVISVNVDAYQLQQPNFVSRVEALLAACPLPKPGSMVFEILESNALQNTDGVSHVIRSCQKLGIGFALDDFGTGYSSLTYLKRLPVETLKIDRSFVRDMLTDRDDLAIVKGVIALAKAFQRRVIAEGVETQAQMDRLKLLGCDCVQGFGIARPMPAEEFHAWIEASQHGLLQAKPV